MTSRSTESALYDVIIVGGGPAGLSTALVLARCRRRVLVVDAGRPRNRWAVEMHGYLTRDGTPPVELLRMGREELAGYGVEIRLAEASRAACDGDGFRLELVDGARFLSRKLVLATGIADELPQIDGLMEMYGSSVHHCPYCDGWEQRDRALAAYGPPESAAALALSLRTWSRDVALLTGGPAELDDSTRRELESEEIPIYEAPVARLEGVGKQLQRVVFTNGEWIARDALFFSAGCRQAADLPAQLGCRFDDKGGVVTDDHERTRVPGLYLVGDASRHVQFVINAAAEGATAAVAINAELQREDRAAREAAGRPPTPLAADAAPIAAAPASAQAPHRGR